MRLFVAFLLHEDVRSCLSDVSRTLVRRSDGVRWVEPEQWHVTVSFLGEVLDRDVAEITQALDLGAAQAQPFSMFVGGLGCFPICGPVRVVWAKVADETGVMVKTVQSIHAALDVVGFPAEARPWSGHITLGRVRNDRSGGRLRTLVDKTGFETVSQSVDSVALMSSVLSPSGARYTPVHVVALG